ncbi:MAG: hypothetical protein M3P18_25130 [Actinomycetota bacterium]|nr:hypothetical protein [Actinomycetota bacterium]
MLSPAYELTFERMLERVALAVTDQDVPLVPFWPLQGSKYDGELLVIGRSVNGWVDDWTAQQLADPPTRRAAIEWLRRDAEPGDGCRMRWVTDLWGARDGYNTARSAFWRVLRRIVLTDPGVALDADRWSSYIAWTNLYKVSPAAGWNPGADLQRAQRGDVTELLKLELAELAPRRVLATTGGWIGPFLGGLGLTLEARYGLVEGVAHRDGVAWVVAKHPMGKPGDEYVRLVLDAFADLGAPLDTGSSDLDGQ